MQNTFLVFVVYSNKSSASFVMNLVFFLPKYVLLQCGTYTILPDLERKIIDRDFRS